MIDVAWTIEEEGRDPEFTGTPRPLLSTWHYLSTALRREWRTWMAMAVLGAELGILAVLLMPPAYSGTVTVLMAHPATVDAASAMATDVSLFNTREVAERTVHELGLNVSPDAFQATTSATPVTPEILTIAVSGSDASGSVKRADTLTKQYLEFRATQLQSLTNGLVSGYRTRIAALQGQVNVLNEQYSSAAAGGVSAQERASEILTKRAQLNSQITTMQQAIEDASLETDAAVTATHVIDAARPVRPSLKKTVVLDVGSGLIAGLALGTGFVLLRALTSDRLRRRQEVAQALGAPVRFSVRTKGPTERGFRRMRRQRARQRSPRRWWPGGAHRRAGDRQDLTTLVRGVEAAVTVARSRPAQGVAAVGSAQPAPSVAVAAIGNPQVAALLIDAAATHLRSLGSAVFLADLSASGALTQLSSPAQVFRPDGVPGLARGPRRAAPAAVIDLPAGHPLRADWDRADVVLALVEVDPGIDVENLQSWVSHVIPLVTAGLSTAELLETTAELIRGAGLALPFAMMLGSDHTDESLGLVTIAGGAPLTVGAS